VRGKPENRPRKDLPRATRRELGLGLPLPSGRSRVIAGPAGDPIIGSFKYVVAMGIGGDAEQPPSTGTANTCKDNHWIREQHIRTNS